MQAQAFTGSCGGVTVTVVSITWSSSDARVLRVGATTGLVHGVAPGLGATRATVTLSDGSVANGVATLRVGELRVDPGALTLRVGDQATFRAFRSGGQNPVPVRWSLSPADGGTISAAGAFRACWPPRSIELAATEIDDSSATGVARIITTPIQPSNPIGALAITESATGAGAKFDSLSEAVEVAIPIRGTEFACHQVSRVRLELRDARGGSTLLADDSVAITSSTIHRVRWLPAGHGPGGYVLVASAVIDGRSVVEGAPVSVRVQNR
jgi:hypothetical protein